MRKPTNPAFVIDWQYLQAGLRLPGLLLLAAGAAFGMSQWLALRTGAALVTVEQALDSATATRDQIAADQTTLAAYSGRYVALVEQGGIGAEQRLAWADALRNLAGELKLPYLRFSTGPQRPVAAERLPPDAAPAVTSTMEIQAGLVHEGDLLRLLAGLRTAPGLFTVQGCSLEKAGDVAAEGGRANITGNCQLQWVSIDPDARPAGDTA